MESSFRLFRVRGIDIGANWSWLFVFVYIVYSLATEVFPSTYEGLDPSSYWVMGAVTGVLFVASLLLHELGHAFRAQREGMEIDGITLWLFGGVARFKGAFPSAGAELRIAIAGPVVTLVLILGFGALWFAARAAGAPEGLVGVLDYLWQINLTLVIFNMVPALPLDGGRVLRASLWQRSGNYTAATVSAARVAKLFAGVIIGAGVLLFVGGAWTGIWLALVGWFVLQAGQAEVTYAMFRQSLRGRTVSDLMTPQPVVVDPEMSVAEFIDAFAHMGGHSTYPVVDPFGRWLGLVSLRLAAQVEPDVRGITRISDVMVPAASLPAVSPADDISVAVSALQQGPGRAVVLSGDRLAGIISMADVARAIEIEEIRSGTPPQPRRRRLRLLLIVGALAGAAYLYTPPFVTFGPGAAFDVTKDITITGMKSDEVDGEYVLTSVAVEQPNVLGVFAALIQGRDLLPLSSVVPTDVDPEEFFEHQEALFKEAQTIAAAAAAKAAGLDVKPNGKGALIEAVSAGAPAEDKLEANDVVVAIDGKPIRLADELSRTIRARPVGTTFRLDVQRGRTERTVEVKSATGIVRGAPGIGVLVSTKDFDVDLPFEVKFRERDIGGPSAGLTYALAVYDLIEDSDLAEGRIIATTGTMDIEGGVGPIGGVEQKTEAAKRANADLFLVPKDEVADVPGSGDGSDLEVVGVATLADALDALRAQRS